MKCKEVHKILPGYLAGDLPEDKFLQLQAHLDSCTDCNALADRVMETEKLLSEKTEITEQPFFYTRLSAKIKKLEEEKMPSAVYKRLLQPAMVAIVVLTAILSGIYLGTSDRIFKDNEYYMESYMENYYFDATNTNKIANSYISEFYETED